MEIIEQKEEAGDEIWKKYLPPGYRFNPTMEELFYYLKSRVFSLPIFPGVIQECDVYRCKPSDLTGYKIDENGNKFAYFFTHTDKVNLNPNAKNHKRTTRDDKGTWKGTSKPTYHRDGKKNTLVYQLNLDGTKNQKKTNWIMHEYVLKDYSKVPNDQDKNLVLCYIYERSKRSTRQENEESFVTEEENMIINNEVEVNPRPVRSLKRKVDGTIDQTLPTREELVTNHNQYSNDPGPSEPKTPMYAPIPYTEPGTTSTGLSSFDVPLSDLVPSFSFADQSASNTGLYDDELMEVFMVQSSSVLSWF